MTQFHCTRCDVLHSPAVLDDDGFCPDCAAKFPTNGRPCSVCAEPSADLDAGGACPDCASALPLDGAPKRLHITLLPKDGEDA